ncbi:hypothetical protein H8959_002535 [Pygathrix nigripes]
MENRTEVTEFILLGLTDDPNLQIPLLLAFLFIYLITLLGNGGMMQAPSDSPSVVLMRLIISSVTFPHSWLSHALTRASAPAIPSSTFQTDITRVFIYRSYSEGDVLSPARHQFTEYTLL